MARPALIAGDDRPAVDGGGAGRDAGSVDRPIADEADVEAVIGAPMVFVRMKVRDHLDAGMRDFIAHAPLVLVSRAGARVLLPLR